MAGSIGFREKDPDEIHTRLRYTGPDGTEVQDVNQVIAEDAFLLEAPLAERDSR